MRRRSGDQTLTLHINTPFILKTTLMFFWGLGPHWAARPIILQHIGVKFRLGGLFVLFK